MDWTYFGWQGMGVEIPSTWELARVTGDEHKGSLSLDDGEQVRLQLKWETPKRLPEVKRVAERYLNFLRRRARKRKIPVEINEDAKFAPITAGRHYFSWKIGKDGKEGASPAYSLAGVCSTCKRVVLLHVLGKGGSRPRAVAQRVFGSFVDHPEGNQQHWRIFGLDFVVPREFTLTSSSFRAGCSRLSFAHRGETLDVARVAVGKTILRKQKFPDWLKTFYGKKISRYLWDYERCQFRGHLALRFWGEEAPARGISRHFRKPAHLYGWAWYCQDTDKILVLWLSRREDDQGQLARGLAEKIICHNTGDSIPD